jgi:hypothetical protein
MVWSARAHRNRPWLIEMPELVDVNNLSAEALRFVTAPSAVAKITPS